MPRRPSPGNITDRYGWRVHPVTGRSQFHEGLDIGWTAGRTLVAPENGRIVGYATRGGWGKRLDLHGDSGTLHYLAHTDRSLAHVGQDVTEGTPIAVMGMTGTATGVHVHWETRPNGGATIDPEKWLATTTGTGGEPITITEEDTMPQPRQIHATFPDGRTYRALTVPGTGYFVKWTETHNTYANGIATGFDTGDSTALTPSLFGAFEREALAMRPKDALTIELAEA